MFGTARMCSQYISSKGGIIVVAEVLHGHERLSPLAPVVVEILLTLVDGERHGYAIKREVARRTGGRVQFGSGTLYGAIARMMAQGLIEESDNRPDQHLDDKRRSYYRLTPAGKRALIAEVARLEALVQCARSNPLFAKR
jgi:DNA-binding PadR family transcriptional regulator